MQASTSHPASPAPASWRDSLRSDLVAGLTAAAVVLPKAMALATVAGLPVEVGLYTCFLPLLIYAALGTSRVLNVTTTTTIAILTGTQLALVVPDRDPQRLLTALATLTALVGAILILAALLRLGFVASFISAPVLTGFKAGIGLVILLDQLPKVLGIHFEKVGWFRDVATLVRHVPETSALTLALAVVTFVVLFGMERFWPRSPAALVAVGGGIAATWWLGLDARGLATVGPIPQGFPALLLPDPALVLPLLPGALGIALMSFTESIASARAFHRTDDPPIRANRELVATGAAGLGGAFFGSLPAGGGASQAALVHSSGGRSQTASTVTAAVSVLTMLVLAPVLARLPQATLAVVVIVSGLTLIDPKEFLAIRRVRTMEFRWAAIACLGVLVVGTLQGILVAILVSLLGLASQVVRPQVHAIGRKRGADVLRPLSPEHPDDETFPGLLIVRPEGRIFFLNAESVAEQVQELIAEHRPRVVALDLSRVPDLEYSALKMLFGADRRAKAEGIEWWLVGLNPTVLEVVRRAGLFEILGRERMLFNARTAIDRYQARTPPA